MDAGQLIYGRAGAALRLLSGEYRPSAKAKEEALR